MEHLRLENKSQQKTKEYHGNHNRDCPFCNIDLSREVIAEVPKVIAIYDSYPVSKGHALIIPKRHCQDYFNLTTEEQSACWAMVNEVEHILNEKFTPDGFNIGINVNEAAGQTINHVHIHLIPRYFGDVDEPEGGVRGVIPTKKNYTKNSKPLH